MIHSVGVKSLPLMSRRITRSSTLLRTINNGDSDCTNVRVSPEQLSIPTSQPVTPSTPSRKRLRERLVVVTPETIVSPTNGEKDNSVRQLNLDQIFEDSQDDFVDLQVHPDELRPSATLTTGQCFHWRAIEKIDSKSSAWGIHNANKWIGVIRIDSGESIVLAIQETATSVLYKVLMGPPNCDTHSVLHRYFQLSIPLRPLYEQWSQQCPRLQQIAACIPGVRIIQQDPWECMVSFLCSSNNNIPRITKMLTAIRSRYGTPLVQLGHNETLYSFPSLEQLAHAREQDLRDYCGMGYRAKYLMQTIQLLETKGGEGYLRNLRLIRNAQAVQDALTAFPGIGRKVADCIALFSLGQTQAIPVDVHVWNVARRDYWPLDNDIPLPKTITPTVYRFVGDLFRTRFPDYSGWAHSLLFVAELPSFRSILPLDVVNEMDRFRTDEKQRKETKRKLE